MVLHSDESGKGDSILDLPIAIPPFGFQGDGKRRSLAIRRPVRLLSFWRDSVVLAFAFFVSSFGLGVVPTNILPDFFY